MANKSNLTARNRSWRQRCLFIEWGWERKRWSIQDVRKVYYLYKDWNKVESEWGQAESVIKRFTGRGRSRLTLSLVRAMVDSYKKYLKAISDGKVCHVKSKDS